ncbi:Hypothetical protein PHPALM_8634 [Phytophthora palmivora]|uniref:Uncharacterized protein n=1 Tax=Phytophthora palmivora TaxID=4796 RepID=A0A2P4Y9D3_9STRA|nr:Hypothetical protein PHPALM_8634 [Phytophthora palmivora]
MQDRGRGREGKYCAEGLPHKTKPYAREYGEGTAVVLRLDERYGGTGRTIVADSAFSSVKTNSIRTFFMGMVKTATVEYPMRHLREWSDAAPAPGEFKVLSSTSACEKPTYAFCCSDPKPKTIISNRVTTLSCADSVRPRHRLIERNG